MTCMLHVFQGWLKSADCARNNSTNFARRKSVGAALIMFAPFAVESGAEDDSVEHAKCR